MGLYIGIGVLVLIVLYFFVTFNRFVQLRNRVREAFSTMDVYLKKRWDLIPNIVETVKGYAKHEQDTLKEIVELRNSAYDKMDNSTKADTNNKITNALGKIMALAEAYPDLKANENFLDLQAQLKDCEEKIGYARQFYNDSVLAYNNKCEMVPSNIIAGMFHFEKEKFFEASEEDRKNVKVEF